MIREAILKFLDKVPDTEFSVPFVQGMVDRMNMSFFKYGKVADAYPSKVDAIKSLHQRLVKYEETGNTEWLMDVGNFAMIEYMYPRHAKAHFESTDSDQSPGRTWHTGSKTPNANTTSQENLRRGGSTLRTDGGFYKSEGD